MTCATGASEGRRTGAVADRATGARRMALAGTHEHMSRQRMQAGRRIGRVAMAGHGAWEKLVLTGRIYGRDLRLIGCVCQSAVGWRWTPTASDSASDGDRGAQ